LPVNQRISRISRINPRIPPPMYMNTLLYVSLKEGIDLAHCWNLAVTGPQGSAA
jgi:hypothetical protein